MADIFDDDEFEAAGTGGGARPPSLKQLGTGCPKVKRVYAPGTPQEQTIETAGRLIIFKPVAIDKNVDGLDGKRVNRLHVDMYVLDGPPIVAVEDKDGDVVHTPETPWVPEFYLPSVYVSQSMIAGKPGGSGGQLGATLERGGKVLGRLGQLKAKPGQSKPWVILSGGTTPEQFAAAKAAFRKLEPKDFE